VSAGRVEKAMGVLEALALLARRRARTPAQHMRALLEPAPDGRGLGPEELALALRTEHLFGLLRVRCLWRAVVITEMLRRRGVQARLRLSVDRTRPSAAHAVVQAGSTLIGSEAESFVVLR